MDNITNFLYLIGSVFAPMLAVQTADFFLLRRDGSARDYDWANLIIWGLGFGFYRLLMTLPAAPVGYTAIDMVVTALLCVAYRKLACRNRKGSGAPEGVHYLPARHFSRKFQVRTF